MKLTKILLSITCAFSVLTLLAFLFINIDKKHQEEYNASHNYIDTVVIDKYYTDGYGGWWFIQGPTYTIVSQETLPDGSTVTWTNKIDETTYNKYNIGDTLVICEHHEKIKEDE